MTGLILSIVLSAILFVGFKWFEQKGVSLLPAVAGNYATCALTGCLMNGGASVEHTGTGILVGCISLGALFFSIFYLMGYSSAQIGVGITGASAKMALVIPVLYGAIALKEGMDAYKILALLLALSAVILMSLERGAKLEARAILIPLAIFIGSGIIDTALNVLQLALKSRGMDTRGAIALVFTGAMCTALIVMLARNRKQLLDIRSLLFGVLLGIPNYFSIYFMVSALRSGRWMSNQFYMINNTGIMALCLLLGWILFREKMNVQKGVGFLLAIISIYLVLFV